MYLKFVHMKGEVVVDIIYWNNSDGDCASMYYALCAVVQTFFHFLSFYGCEVQGVAST